MLHRSSSIRSRIRACVIAWPLTAREAFSWVISYMSHVIVFRLCFGNNKIGAYTNRRTVSILGKIKERLGLKTNFLTLAASSYFLTHSFDQSIIIEYICVDLSIPKIIETSSPTRDVDMLNINAASAAIVLAASAFLDILHRPLTLVMSLTLTLTLLGSGQLAEQGANISTAKWVDQGGLSHPAVTEQFDFDARERRLLALGGRTLLSEVLNAADLTCHGANSSCHQLFDRLVIFVRWHRLKTLLTRDV